MLEFALSALSPLNIFLAVFGVAAGTIIGSIPGLTATMAVAVLAPFTYPMGTDSALIFLGSIYTGAIYGGAYAAILLNTPGTPSAIATTFDGYPLAKAGKGDVAVSVSVLASVAGGLVGGLALLFLSPPLAEAALAFSPVEYFWMAIFGLALISSLSKGEFFKGIIGACLGLLIAMIGVSETSGQVRYTFGTTTLIGGIDVVSALIGLYCIPVLINLVAFPDKHLDAPQQPKGFQLPAAFAAVLKNKFNLLRSSVIGTLVGALPGAGGSIAGLVAYSEAKRTNKNDPEYGSGNPGGIIATESANNATVGGGFVPTLVLGIPGTPPDAVILGALLVQGVRVGPELFTESADIVYTFIFGLLLATVLMLPIGLLIGRYAYSLIVRAPKAGLVPVVAFMTVLGTFAIRNNISDIIIMVALGVFAWVVGRRGISASPIVLGLILGRIAEEGFVQGWTIGDALGNVPAQFFGRPISLVIIACTVATFVYPFLPELKKLWRKTPAPRRQLDDEQEGRIVEDVKTLLFMGIIAAVFGYSAHGLTPDAYVFPVTVSVAMLVFVALALLRLALNKHATPIAAAGSWPRIVALPAIMLGGVFLLPVLGFVFTAPLMGLALIIPAYHGDNLLSNWFRLSLPVIGLILGCVFLFSHLLGVALP